MGGKYTPSQKKAIEKYIREKTDDIRVRLPKGSKEKFKKAAERRNLSLSKYLNYLVDRDIKELDDLDLPV